MRRDKGAQLETTVQKLRHKMIVVNGEKIPESVAFLERELANTKDAITRAEIYGMICDECVFNNLYQREIDTLRARAAEFVDEPVPLVSLATGLSREPKTQDEARRVIETALIKALSANRFVRYTLGERARFARIMGDFELLQDCLKRLIADVGSKRSEDCGFEMDFVDGLEHDPIVSPLVSEYLKAIGKSPM